MPSLQDQLLKAGLADEKTAKAVRNEKKKKRKQQPKGPQRSTKPSYGPVRPGKRRRNVTGN